MDSSLFRGRHAPISWSGTVLALCFLASSTGGAQQPVSFKNNIAPIFENHCVECHQPGGRGYEASGLDLRSYEGLMRGTRFGPVVVPGDVFSSNLVRIVQGQVASQIRMPYQHPPLSESQTLAIQRWVIDGAKDN